MHLTRGYIYIYDKFFLHATMCVCPHTYLSLWVCSYIYSKILQKYIHEKFQKQPYFLNILYIYLVLLYKISMSIYSMYGHIPNIYIYYYIYSSMNTYFTYILFVRSSTWSMWSYLNICDESPRVRIGSRDSGRQSTAMAAASTDLI